MASITGEPTTWDCEALAGLKAEYPDLASLTTDAVTKYNPTPGTGRTGYVSVPPNNYPFYSEDEKYVPIVQADGGQLSEWKPMYNPTAEQAGKDRQAAYEAGVPHGFVAPGDKHAGQATITLRVLSELHADDEYGVNVDEQGRHSGGPFDLEVSPLMRIEDLRKLIRDKSGIIPALQKLSYAGKNLDDPQRTLAHYGVAYWHSKFPHWPLKIRRY
ncbi:hypothetical protein QBZ16_003081 [Prototheca wickerhamii]|uniref:Ubiquitin-like domain-containing protein n=1 Tax=Prototheca wickerhamii TaxID=3111 RepID=A0AAD9ILH5_PROWI|nr:hypothetical protein QBZ16_003081 [Prototheca wickerhamii]